MEMDYLKIYIERADLCRKTKNSKESIAKMYDLLYSLEAKDRTKEQDLVLVSVYVFLGFHQSAYELAKLSIDVTNRKNIVKLYSLETKAKSHQDNFIIKDIRKLKQKNVPVLLLPTDFIITPIQKKVFHIERDIVVFNKILKADRVKIVVDSADELENHIDKINDYLRWIADCRKELMLFYNQELGENMHQIAELDWYDTLEVFGLRIIIGDRGHLYAEISNGDEIMPDHILDIEIQDFKIVAMAYDG